MKNESHRLAFLQRTELSPKILGFVQELGLETVKDVTENHPVYLGYEDSFFLLMRDGQTEFKFNIDFSSGTLDYRRRYGQRGGQLLVKAVGGQSKSVFDATAGLGRDLFILAAHGLNVSAMEKSPVIFLLLRDAIDRGCRDERLLSLFSRVKLERGDSLEKIRSLSEGAFDCIYLDPMFPTSKKSSLPKKELQILQVLNRMGEDHSLNEDLLASAREKCRRVVVKRPVHCEPLAPGVSNVLKGSSIRFDIYCR